MDHDLEALRAGLAALVDADLMSLRRPLSYGGPDVPEVEFREFQELVASVSGALAFLQTQHQSAVSLIRKSGSEDLRARVLPTMHRAEDLTGIGFSQLRRPGEPLLLATDVPEGIRLDGHLPWATGFGIFPRLLVAGEFPDRRSVFGLVPFSDGPGVKFSASMRLAAMEAAQTVTADFDAYVIPHHLIVDRKAPEWIHRNDMINITLQGFFALGNTRASLKLIAGANERRKSAVLAGVHDSLRQELDEVREGLTRATTIDGETTTQAKLDLRGWAIDLMGRAAHAAVTACSGAANGVEHPAQRVYREALVFTVSAQTTAIMESTVRRMVRHPSDRPEPS